MRPRPPTALSLASPSNTTRGRLRIGREQPVARRGRTTRRPGSAHRPDVRRRPAGETSASASLRARADSSEANRRVRCRSDPSRQRTSQPPRCRRTLTRTHGLMPPTRQLSPDCGYDGCLLPPGDKTYSRGRRVETGPRQQKAPVCRGFSSAPERTRTSTDHKVHKALNLARLPIPPQALEAASIALRGPLGADLGLDEARWSGRSPRSRPQIRGPFERAG